MVAILGHYDAMKICQSQAFRPPKQAWSGEIVIKKAVASGNQCHGWRIPWNLSFSCSLRKITRGYIGKQKFYIFIPLKVENLSFFGGWSSNIIELNGWIPASQGVFHRGYGFFLHVSTVSWMIPSNPGPGGLLDQQCLSFMLQRVFAVTENYQARVRIALQNSPKPPLLLVVSCCLLGIFFSVTLAFTNGWLVVWNMAFIFPEYMGIILPID